MPANARAAGRSGFEANCCSCEGCAECTFGLVRTEIDPTDRPVSMLQVTQADVLESPFPHIVKQDIIDPVLFRELRADFPTSQGFQQQFDETGTAGSRVGGFDIYRGDRAYDQLIAASPAWSKFDAYINSASFVETFLDVFGDRLGALGCRVAVDPGRYQRDFVEAREVLTEKKTTGDMLSEIGFKLLGRGGSKAVDLFTRLDIEKSMGGYAKPPHCDRANRLCSLIVYFTDTEAAGIVGGELNVYAHKQKTVPADHERHPRPQDVSIVQMLKPRENLGVFFPCSNNSYHGVNAVETVGIARDFLYINISTKAPICW